MFSKWFKSKDTEETTASGPEILGLRNKASFELDSLLLRLTNNDLVTNNIAPTQIILASGLVELDDVYIARFYTDDEAFLQVVIQGELKDENVVDVKLFHYYKTIDIGSDSDWNRLLNQEIGCAEYSLEGHTYHRVWESTSDYHKPVHMHEQTFDEDGDTSETDQFTMLFEREYATDSFESVFLSAEESVDEHDNISRCLVISTGITLSASQITIHG